MPLFQAAVTLLHKFLKEGKLDHDGMEHFRDKYFCSREDFKRFQVSVFSAFILVGPMNLDFLRPRL